MKPKHERGEFDVVSQEEVDEIMKNYDPESNVRIWSGWQEYAVKGILAAFSVYTIYVTLFATLLDQVRLPSFVGLGILMGYLVYPARKGKQKINHIPWYDWIIMILGTAAFFYFVFNAQAIIKQGIYFAWYEYVIGAIGILALAELCRRSVGIPILCVAAFFVCYALYFFSQKLGFLGALKTMIYRLFYTTTGIFTTPIDVCSKYIAVFIIFGAFLERTGISDFFIQLANSLAGSASGGPAKVAVISSALCGMVSGSSVGNTVTTGSVTIPMMKKTGYRPEFAGAVEAAASTGGQIMPPVMGAAAFLMIDYVGVPYSSIIVRAILPAVLYFMGIFIAVHLEAKRTGLRGIPKDQLPVFSKLIKKAYLLLPLIILVVMVSMNLKTMAFSAATAIVACIVVSLFNKENRITPMKFFDALANGGKSCISIIAACGVAGCVAGCIAMTGLASQIISFIIRIAGDKLIIALFFTMLCCIVLGMGVPTTANYCIMASTCAPILIKMGVPIIAAHFFVFYFGIVADITPPVALAAYAGSAIAKSDPMKTGVNATRLAIAAFIVPYIFAMDPTMMFVGGVTWYQVVLICITSVIGIYGVASGLAGFTFTNMAWYMRILAIVGGLMLLAPSTWTDIVGLVIVAGVIVIQYLLSKKHTATPAQA
ncbi:MAG: TRAP transporter permease [Clostridia bacterium]|nr:TRAP transporter permease [Clostridia bacterium]MBQ6866814.1 TRAP transporter permease [Clostridia bacterium]MBQ9323306.1 TRAP transporter permease [Clostridia bacterium]MBR0422132.1 TRAP transporter permease [Clostridia bacterium]